MVRVFVVISRAREFETRELLLRLQRVLPRAPRQGISSLWAGLYAAPWAGLYAAPWAGLYAATGMIAQISLPRSRARLTRQQHVHTGTLHVIRCRRGFPGA